MGLERPLGWPYDFITREHTKPGSRPFPFSISPSNLR